MKKTILTTTALVSCLTLAGPAFANPTGATIVNGGVEIEGEGTANVTVTNTPGSIINWDSFSIQSGEIVTFNQESDASAILNRVIGADPSEIWGRLESNGRVFLINRNGIMFKAGARIDVAGLVASTLELSDDNFLSGLYYFTDNGGDGLMTSEGDVKIWTGDKSDNGQIWLIARKITTSQQTEIDAPGGQVALAAGNTVSVVDSGLGRMEFQLATSASSTIEHLGHITTERGSAGLFADSILLGSYAGGGGSVIAEPELGETASVSLIADRDVLIDEGALVSASGDGDDDGGSITIVAANGTLQIHKDAGVHADGGLGGNGGTIGLTGHVVEIDTLTNGMTTVTALSGAVSGEQGLVSINETGTHSYAINEVTYLADTDTQTNDGNLSYRLTDRGNDDFRIVPLTGGGYAVVNSRAFTERFDRLTGSGWDTTWVKDSYMQITVFDADDNQVGTYTMGKDYPGGQSPTEDLLYNWEVADGVVPLDTGGFAVVYRVGSHAGNNTIVPTAYIQRFDATGNPVGSPISLGETYQANAVKLDDDTFAALTWNSQPESTTSIVYSYDASGNITGQPDYLDTFIYGNVWPTGGGDFIGQISPESLNGPMLGRVPDGYNSALPFLEVPDDLLNIYYGDFDGLIGGTIAVTGVANATYDYSLGRFDGNGNMLGSTQALPTQYSDNILVPLSNGGFAIVGSSEQSGGGAILQTFNGMGEEQGAAKHLGPTDLFRRAIAASGLPNGEFVTLGVTEREGGQGYVISRTTRTLTEGTVTGAVTGGMPNVSAYNTSPGAINGEWGLFQNPTDPLPDVPTDPVPDGFGEFSTDMQNAFQNLYAAIESGNKDLALSAWDIAKQYWEEQLEENANNNDDTDWDAIMAQSSERFKALVEGSDWQDAAAEMRRLMDKMRGGDAAAFVETLTETERTLLRSEIQSQLTALIGVKHTAEINFNATRQELENQKQNLDDLVTGLGVAGAMLGAANAIKGVISGPPPESLVQGTAATSFLESINLSTSTVAQDFYWKQATGIVQGTTGALIAVGCTNCIDPEYQDTALTESGSLAMKFYSDINDPMFWVNVIAEYTGSNPSEAMDQAANTLNVLENTTLRELDAKIEALEKLLGYLG